MRNPYAAKLKKKHSSRLINNRLVQSDADNAEESKNSGNESGKDTLTQLREAVRLRARAKGKASKKK